MWSILLCTWTGIYFVCKITSYINFKLNVLYPKTDLLEIDRERNYVLQVTSSSADEESAGNFFHSFETLLWCLGTVVQQGWHTLPTTTSTRLTIISGLLLSVVCYAAYTGKIVSELYDVPKSIKSLNQLLAYADELYLISSGDTSDDMLEGVARTAPNALKKIKFQTVEVISKKLEKLPGKVCAISWPDTIYAYVEESMENVKGASVGAVDAYICDTFHSFSFQAFSSLFVPKYSELEQLFNYRIIVGLERGFIRRYWRTYLRHTKLFCLRNNPKVTTLDFGHVFFAFFILWSGMVLCIVLLLLENVTNTVLKRIPVV